MPKEQIKKDLHSMIDDIDEDYVSNQINSSVNQVLEDKILNWDSLSDEEKNLILRGLDELERGENTDYEDLKRDVNNWLGR